MRVIDHYSCTFSGISGDAAPHTGPSARYGLSSAGPSASVVSSDEVQIWYARTESIDRDALGACDTLLTAEERARRDRFVHFEDGRDYSVAHALTRWALSRCSDRPALSWRFETTAHGKPAITASQAGDPPLAFNLTHTRGIVACVIAKGGSVGIDVERINRRDALRDIAGRYFTASEVHILNACSEGEYAARFIELWTLKESYIKGIGLGLTCPLDSFSFSFQESSAVSLSAPADPGWTFILAKLPGDARMAMARLPGHSPSRPRVAVHGLNLESDDAATLLRSTQGVACACAFASSSCLPF